MDKQRFKELYRLAHGGDTVAKADLWLEFGFAYDHDPLPAFTNSSLLEGEVPSEPCPSSDLSRLFSDSSVLSRGQQNPSAPKQEMPCE